MANSGFIYNGTFHIRIESPDVSKGLLSVPLKLVDLGADEPLLTYVGAE